MALRLRVPRREQEHCRQVLARCSAWCPRGDHAPQHQARDPQSRVPARRAVDAARCSPIAWATSSPTAYTFWSALRRQPERPRRAEAGRACGEGRRGAATPARRPAPSIRTGPTGGARRPPNAAARNATARLGQMRPSRRSGTTTTFFAALPSGARDRRRQRDSAGATAPGAAVVAPPRDVAEAAAEPDRPGRDGSGARGRSVAGGTPTARGPRRRGGRRLRFAGRKPAEEMSKRSAVGGPSPAEADVSPRAPPGPADEPRDPGRDGRGQI